MKRVISTRGSNSGKLKHFRTVFVSRLVIIDEYSELRSKYPYVDFMYIEPRYTNSSW